MMKNEYLSRLKSELKKNNIADAEDIICEYEQHFAYKLADGYTEEEIAAKLGSPQMIASQFESARIKGQNSSGGNFFTKIALSFLALFEAMIYIMFFAWVISVFIASLASATIGVCLIGQVNVAGLIPYMPYTGGLILGICLLAFAVFLAVAAYYCYACIKQIIKASVRWHKNMTSANPLPQLPWNPQFKDSTRRLLRTILIFSVTVFGVAFVLAYIVLTLQAGALGFWHVWGWFVN